MRVHRYEGNPLITPADVPPHHQGFEVIGTFNAGVARYRDEILLLLRIAERPVNPHPDYVDAAHFDAERGELIRRTFHRQAPAFDFTDPRAIRPVDADAGVYLTSLSYLRLARSTDGRRFVIDSKPFLYPANELESFGIEDPRITPIDDRYYITYSAVSPFGVAVGLASTRDFVHVERHGLIFPPENKNVVLFPERIGGSYYALHRPVPRGLGSPAMWLARSHTLSEWGGHQPVLGLRPGMWDSARIGAGAVPFRTREGWLELYHGADESNRYCVGAVLLDVADPSRVLARTAKPLLAPETRYETDGFFGNVVFSCGALVDDDVVAVYYGAADTCVACAELSLHEILAALT